MTPLDFSKCLIPPYEHQRQGTWILVHNEVFAIFDEMGAGKTKQVIDAACFLFEADAIDTVVIVSPASVRAVWAGEFGEIRKHAFVDHVITEFHAKTPRIPAVNDHALQWVVTNYEFVRNADKLALLTAQLRGRRVMVVLDESSRIKNPRASTTKAMLKLARSAQRRVILNGTPISNNPLDLFAQLAFLNPGIIGSKNFFWFRARYALMGGYMNKQVIGWQHLEELQHKIAPFCLRRLKKDCLDLPDKIFTVREARMSASDWKTYKAMRDDCVAWLDTETAAMAPQTIVRLMRLSQLTAGFIGGLETPLVDQDLLTAELDDAPRELHRIKIDVLLDQIADWLEEDPNLHLLVWCRFRFELARTRAAVLERFPHVWTGVIQGGQKELDRRAVVNIFQTPVTTSTPRIVFGNPQAGGLGLTLTAAHRVIYLSNDYNLVTRLQSEDRVHRPGQTHKVLYTDVIATGPDGQRTIDHVIVNALRKKEDLANWTTAAWRRELQDDHPFPCADAA